MGIETAKVDANNLGGCKAIGAAIEMVPRFTINSIKYSAFCNLQHILLR